MFSTKSVTQFVISPHLNLSEQSNTSCVSKNLNMLFQSQLRNAHLAQPLLTKVCEGNLWVVKQMLDEEKKPAFLLTQKSKIKDLSGRIFENISPFQYALWAKDILMLKLMQKYLSPEQISELMTEHESECKPSYVAAHGRYFELANLCAKLKYYIDNHEAMPQADAEKYWRSEIGGQQFLLPMHIVNLYCHPTGYFTLNPEFIFDETIAVRYDRIRDDIPWYSPDLGISYAISRGDHPDKAWKTNNGAGDWLSVDLTVLSAFAIALENEMKNFKDNHKRNELDFLQI